MSFVSSRVKDKHEFSGGFLRDSSKSTAEHELVTFYLGDFSGHSKFLEINALFWAAELREMIKKQAIRKGHKWEEVALGNDGQNKFIGTYFTPERQG